MAAMPPAEDGGEPTQPPERANDAGNADTDAAPTPPADFQIHNVRVRDGGAQPELSRCEFEELRKQCDEGYYSCGEQIVRPELRWPRDIASLTPRQRELVERRLRVLVSDRDHEFFEVQFTPAPWLVVPCNGRNE